MGSIVGARAGAGAGPGAGAGAGTGEGARPDRRVQMIPATTYLTPSGIVARRLLNYSRERHLTPAINIFAKQVRGISCDIILVPLTLY